VWGLFGGVGGGGSFSWSSIYASQWGVPQRTCAWEGRGVRKGWGNSQNPSRDQKAEIPQIRRRPVNEEKGTIQIGGMKKIGVKKKEGGTHQPAYNIEMGKKEVRKGSIYRSRKIKPVEKGQLGVKEKMGIPIRLTKVKLGGEGKGGKKTSKWGKSEDS